MEEPFSDYVALSGSVCFNEKYQNSALENGINPDTYTVTYTVSVLIEKGATMHLDVLQQSA